VGPAAARSCDCVDQRGPNEIGRPWSSCWYNGFIYELEITKGLHPCRLSDPVTAGAIRLAQLNSQTGEFSLP
jgi:hypothetical protein